MAGNEGDGAMELQNVIARNAAQDRIVYLGQIDEHQRVWLAANCSVFVSPSRFEGFGLAIAEAAAHGKPVVTTNVGAVREVLGADDRVYCGSVDPSDIADTVRQALDNPTLAAAIGRAAQLSVSRFSIAAKTAQVRELLKTADG